MENEPMYGNAILKLAEQVSELSIQLEAIQRVLDSKGIARDEINAAAQELRAQGREKFERDAEAARKAASIGDAWRERAAQGSHVQ
jgi:hypothetical protein